LKTIEEVLLYIKAVKLSPKTPFTYASGIISPIYCDNRVIISYPYEREFVISLFIDKINKTNIEFDVVAGTATAGIPHAAWIAEFFKKPMIYVRSSKKNHGKENLIEGILKKGQKVILIEDLLSTGGSSVNAAKAIRESGGLIDYIFAIFSYEMKKCKQNFKNENLKYETLGNISNIIDIASDSGYISLEDKNIILEWKKDPENWIKKR